ncbi:MAG: nucleotidyltransferase domain-containing protein [Chloroflexi bacterium]|nr:nucleotidyltransferase domain-containing protein [Chloroflexota bacterium]
MGTRVTPTPSAKSAVQEKLIVEFARLMRQGYGARVYLFGSRARGTAGPESDYDLVAVSRAFEEQSVFERALDRHVLWRQSGGWGIGLDLHCYTPAEFRRQIDGLGYLGQARRRGELIEVRTREAI